MCVCLLLKLKKCYAGGCNIQSHLFFLHMCYIVYLCSSVNLMKTHWIYASLSLFWPEEALQSCSEKEEVHRGPWYQDNRWWGWAGRCRCYYNRSSCGFHQWRDSSTAQTGNGAGCGRTTQHAVLCGECRTVLTKLFLLWWGWKDLHKDMNADRMGVEWF